ncbi:hypothetical protein [Tsuneonella mangrovi]|uniref:hypothetical protein n=1 Tax=Tsuneonella mangrovi TaxID=1982042 RepID=UPI0012377C17|nr:hypothetical protein [Tsuneonella mangrovi]
MSSGLELKPTSEPSEIDWEDADGAVEAMVEWFLANFEDPAMETPYESAEGGYIYIWGGPYDAQVELWDAFPDASEELIERAVDEIQSDGLFDWAPAGIRIQPDDLPDDDAPHPSLEERLEALGEQLDRIEQHIAYWRDRAPQMGHNGPPDEFRLDPDDEDLVAAEASVAEVRGELAKPDRANAADAEVIQKAESAFKRLADKIRGWIKAGLGALALGAIGGAGKVMGEAIAKDPEKFWSELTEAGSTLAHWAEHLIGLL